MSLEAEVCRAHRSAHCTECDEFNDDLWINPRDLPAPHEDCSLCKQLVIHRQINVIKLADAIELLEDEIAEIERGDRHNAYHAQLVSEETPK